MLRHTMKISRASYFFCRELGQNERLAESSGVREIVQSGLCCDQYAGKTIYRKTGTSVDCVPVCQMVGCRRPICQTVRKKIRNLPSCPAEFAWRSSSRKHHAALIAAPPHLATTLIRHHISSPQEQSEHLAIFRFARTDFSSASPHARHCANIIKRSVPARRSHI